MTTPASPSLPQDALAPITVTLSDRLISELPRFFGGWKAMLREILQNAHRAGATAVRVDSANLSITISDNGCGIPNPAILFAAGTSGWDERDVIAAAGLGVFAMLDPSLIERLTITSGDWTLTTTPDAALRQEAIQPVSHPHTTGTIIALELQAGIDGFTMANALRDARAYYPFTLEWNNTIMECPAHPNTYADALTISTPDGELTMNSIQGGYCHHFVLWEYRPIPCDLTVQSRDALEVAISHSHLTFTPSQSCEVRPKLPDRNAIEDNHVWQATKRRLISAFAQALRTQLQTLDIGQETTVNALRQSMTGTNSAVIAALLQTSGWHECVTVNTALDQINYQNGEEGVKYYGADRVVYARNAVAIKSQRAAQTQNIISQLEPEAHQHPYTTGDHGLKESVDYEQSTTNDAIIGGWLTRADEIYLENQLHLPCLIDFTGETPSVIAGHLNTAWDTLHGPLREALVYAAIIRQNTNGDIGLSELEWFDTNGNARPELILSHLETELLKLHGIDHENDLQRLRTLSNTLEDTERMIRDLGFAAKIHPNLGPIINASQTQIGALKRELESEIDTINSHKQLSATGVG